MYSWSILSEMFCKLFSQYMAHLFTFLMGHLTSRCLMNAKLSVIFFSYPWCFCIVSEFYILGKNMPIYRAHGSSPLFIFSRSYILWTGMISFMILHELISVCMVWGRKCIISFLYGWLRSLIFHLSIILLVVFSLSHLILFLFFSFPVIFWVWLCLYLIFSHISLF